MAGRQVAGWLGGSRDSDQIPQGGELRLSDPGDLQKIFYLLKRTVLLTKGNDSLRKYRPDTRQGLESRGVCPIEGHEAVARNCDVARARLRAGKDHLLAGLDRLGEIDQIRSSADSHPARRFYGVGHDRAFADSDHTWPHYPTRHVDLEGACRS